MRNMSWKRIFRTARKVGAPVIIADEDGKKPQVILPLDEYEMLIDEHQGVDFDDFEIDNIPEFEFDDGISEEELQNLDDEDGFELPEFDGEMPEIVDFDDDLDEVPEISFDDKGKVKIGEIEKGNSKRVSPDELAAPAFEFEDSLESGGVEPLDIPEFDQIAKEERKEELKQDSSKFSEEMDVEDRFYFEPIDDESEKD